MDNLNQILIESAQVLSKLNPHVVGGAVRDRLLKRPTLDIDLVTLGDPDVLAGKLASRLGGKSFRLDEAFGITRISLKNGVQLDLSKAQGPDVLTDLKRRDFTINAMAVPLQAWNTAQWKKSLLDPFKGEADLKNKRLAPVSKKIFTDDPLRLLRAFRIGAELDIPVSSQLVSFIRKNKSLIRKPAAERVREEMLKLFSVDHAYPYVFLMEKSGLLEQLLPVCLKLRQTGLKYYGKGGVLTHTLDSLMLLEDIIQTKSSWFPKVHKKVGEDLKVPMSGYPRSAHLKWGILLHDIGKPDTAKVIDGRLRFFEHEHVGADMVAPIAKRFRWSSDESSLYAKLVRNHMRPGNLATHEVTTDKAIHRFFRDLGPDAIGMLLVSLGDHLSYLSPRQRKARNSAHEVLTIKMVNKYYLERTKILPERLLNGHEVMKAFDLDPSPLIGELLQDLMEAQAEGKVSTREQALTYLRSQIERHS